MFLHKKKAQAANHLETGVYTSALNMWENALRQDRELTGSDYEQRIADITAALGIYYTDDLVELDVITRAAGIDIASNLPADILGLSFSSVAEQPSQSSRFNIHRVLGAIASGMVFADLTGTLLHNQNKN